MRDPKRIKNIMERVIELWGIYPDQRFFQFMHNLNSTANKALGNPADFDLYNLEDDQLLKLLNKIKTEKER